jgi:hypothetical protein
MTSDDWDILDREVHDREVHDPNTPDGFKFVTNVGSEKDDEADFDSYGESGSGDINKYVEKYGADNVVVTTPAYDVDGNPWDGRAIHIRIGVEPKS